MNKKTIKIALGAALLLVGLVAFSHHRALVLEGENADAVERKLGRDPIPPVREENFILFDSGSPSWLPHWTIYYWRFPEDQEPIVASAVNIFGFETGEYSSDLKKYTRWQPLSVFEHSTPEYWWVTCVYAFAALAIGLFLLRIFSARYRTEPFPSWTLLLTGVPFAVGSWRCYDLLQYCWFLRRLADTEGTALQAGYHYQLGVIVSLSMVALYVAAWKIRQRPAAVP